jgi:predicted DNA-binding transcriptional regulator AlpA
MLDFSNLAGMDVAAMLDRLRERLPGGVVGDLLTRRLAAYVEGQSALLGVGDVAALLGVSTRSVHRLRDRGAIPPPIKLGAAVRWSRRVIEAWIAEGCPMVKAGEVMLAKTAGAEG